MMNMLSSRTLNACLMMSAAALLPAAAFAQDVAPYSENASNVIGALVVWLLPIGGQPAPLGARRTRPTSNARAGTLCLVDNRRPEQLLFLAEPLRIG